MYTNYNSRDLSYVLKYLMSYLHIQQQKVGTLIIHNLKNRLELLCR